MTEVRTKDKLFLAFALPLAAWAIYAYAWRADAAKGVAALAAQRDGLVAEEDFDGEFAAAARGRKAAEAELAAERAVPMPAGEVEADAAESVAERERAVLAVFRGAGLHVVSCRPSGETGERSGRGGDVLKATGVRPGPVRRIYLVDGSYPSVAAALAAFVERRMAVVLESFAMSDSPLPRWKLEVWL